MFIKFFSLRFLFRSLLSQSSNCKVRLINIRSRILDETNYLSLFAACVTVCPVEKPQTRPSQDPKILNSPSPPDDQNPTMVTSSKSLESRNLCKKYLNWQKNAV